MSTTPVLKDRALVTALESIVGRAACLTDPEVIAGQCVDWTGRFSGGATAVVRPGGVDEVAEVLRAVSGHGAVVVPQGGNTGLVGGSVPRSKPDEGRPQVVLDLRRLNEIAPGDGAAGWLEAGAGVTLADAAAAARHLGCHLGIDIGARDSATLGGMVATNAGGMHVVAYGAMRQRVAGIEGVLADGTIATQLKGLVKDNVSWDLASLLCGSEGTLAVVTRVLVRLEPLPAYTVTALAGLADARAAARIANGPLRSVPGLEAAELTLLDGTRLVCQHAGLPDPPGLRAGATAWLTVEAAGPSDPTEALAGALDDESVIDAAVATDESTRQRLWAYRDRHTEAIATLGIPHKLDVSTRPDRLPELIDRLPAVVSGAAPGSRLVLFGHLADGNVHVNVIGPDPDDERVDDAVFGLVTELGGSISAEHGIGVAKRRWLASAREPGMLEVMRRVKQALDPDRILNPGVLEPL